VGGFEAMALAVAEPQCEIPPLFD